MCEVTFREIYFGTRSLLTQVQAAVVVSARGPVLTQRGVVPGGRGPGTTDRGLAEGLVQSVAYGPTHCLVLTKLRCSHGTGAEGPEVHRLSALDLHVRRRSDARQSGQSTRLLRVAAYRSQY